MYKYYYIMLIKKLHSNFVITQQLCDLAASIISRNIRENASKVQNVEL